MGRSWRTAYEAVQLPTASPRALAQVPSVAGLRAAGASRSSKALDEAIELRDRAVAARNATRAAAQAVGAARERDAAEDAKLVAAKTTTLPAPHLAAAEHELGVAQRIERALVEGVERALDELASTVEAERDVVSDHAAEAREQGVRRVAELIEGLEAELAAVQDAVDAASWVSRWPNRWQRPLSGVDGFRGLGRPLNVGQLLGLIRQLPAVLASVQLPNEGESAAGVPLSNPAWERSMQKRYG
jgi:hypothetical protein